MKTMQTDNVNDVSTMQNMAAAGRSETVQPRDGREDQKMNDGSKTYPASSNKVMSDGTVVSKDGDTLNISKTDGYVQKVSKEETAGSKKVDTNDLSQYTKHELKTMLDNGEITHHEYDEEIKKRSYSTGSDSDASDTQSGDDTAAAQYQSPDTDNADAGAKTKA